MLAAATTAVLAAACSTAGRATPPVAGPSPQIFTMRLIYDHPRLDRGVLTYSELSTMQVRQTTAFEVQVTDVGRGPERTAFTSRLRGRLAAPQDVPTGGVVSVQITCGSELTCTPGPAPVRQAIFGTGRSGTWTWDIAATAPGQPQILLTAIRYRGNSQVVRTQTIVAVGLSVRSTPAYAVEAAVDARKGPIVSASAAMLAAAGALGAALVLRRRRGRGRTAAAARTRPAAELSQAETVTWPAISRPAPAPGGLPEARRTLARTARPGWPHRVQPGWRRRIRPEWPGRAWPGWPRQAWPRRSRQARPGWPRPQPGRLRKAWLGWLLIDIAAGVLVLSLVRGTTSERPAFALAAAAVAVVVLPVYFLPAFVAHARRVPDFPSAAVINGILGWTFIGWVAALALALRDRRPETAVTPAAGPVPASYPALVARPGAAAPGMREIQRRGAGVTFVLWQTPDESLTCQDPDDSWVSRWTYCVSPGQDGRPQFVLTGERHGCLVGPYPGPE